MGGGWWGGQSRGRGEEELGWGSAVEWAIMIVCGLGSQEPIHQSSKTDEKRFINLSVNRLILLFSVFLSSSTECLQT